MTVPNSAPTKLPHQRQHEIHKLTLTHGAVDVAELARRFSVTTETIRRDLSDLQARQLVRRVHGGAVPVERVSHEPMVDARDMVNADEKLRIATVAAAHAPESGSVIIDSGSTGQSLAEVLRVDTDLHVVTNSLVTALTLSRRGLRRLTLLGGAVRTNTFAMVDISARAALLGIAVDVTFMSCDGLSFQRGLTTPYREEQAMKRAMIESAARVVAMVDESKFQNNQMFSFAAFDELDLLVTDTRVDDDSVEVLTGLGVSVLRA